MNVLKTWVQNREAILCQKLWESSRICKWTISNCSCITKA